MFPQGRDSHLLSLLIANLLAEESFFFFFSLLFFLGLHLQHMEIPRPGVESELQLLAYTTATAMPDP